MSEHDTHSIAEITCPKQQMPQVHLRTFQYEGAKK